MGGEPMATAHLNGAVLANPAMPSSIRNEWRKKRKRARYRLASIARDANFVQKVIDLHFQHEKSQDVQTRSKWAVVANQRAGSWYVAPPRNTQEDDQIVAASKNCYFKSTDGHASNTASRFSLKRLNLQLLDVSAKYDGCFIVDVSRTKIMPDSFSRTIPIWCLVINRIVLHYAADEEARRFYDEWDTTLHTPADIISEVERDEIMAGISDIVTSLVDCNSIDVDWLLEAVKKPLRPYWICNNGDIDGISLPEYDSHRYQCIVCVSASNPNPSSRDILPWYTPGAGDDHESWSRGLSPSLFWQNIDLLLPKDGEEDSWSDGDTDKAINMIVNKARAEDEEWESNHALDIKMNYSFIGKSGMAIGTRSAGRPPLVWETFDAVLNITTMEYDGMATGEDVPDHKAYLNCSVKEGKRDKTELEKWLPVAIVFVLRNLTSDRKVLIHCAQGMDRSVAVVMAAAILFCETNEGKDLALNEFGEDTLYHLDADPYDMLSEYWNDDDSLDYYKSSRMKQELVDFLLSAEGRLALFDAYGQTMYFHSLETVEEKQEYVKARWEADQVEEELSSDDDSGEGDYICQHMPPLADKDSLRQILHLITRYHERASPSRSTMQKLNRFFMSFSILATKPDNEENLSDDD